MHWSDMASEKIRNRKQLRQERRASSEVIALIIETMNKLNIGRRELAKMLGESDEYVKLLLEGETDPTLKEISNVFTALDSSLHFSRDDEPGDDPLRISGVDIDGDLLSLGKLIEIAVIAAEKSPLGLETAVCLCESERETVAFADATLELDDDGATFLVSLHKLGVNDHRPVLER